MKYRKYGSRRWEDPSWIDTGLYGRELYTIFFAPFIGLNPTLWAVTNGGKFFDRGRL